MAARGRGNKLEGINGTNVLGNNPHIPSDEVAKSLEKPAKETVAKQEHHSASQPFVPSADAAATLEKPKVWKKGLQYDPICLTFVV